MSFSIEDLTQDHLRESIQWIATMGDSDKWDLTDDEIAALLGGIDAKTYQDMRRRAENDEQIAMSHDTIERLSLLLGIWKSLQLIVPDNRQDLAHSWFNKPNSNSTFMGKSIKQYLLDNRAIESLCVVCAYLRSY